MTYSGKKWSLQMTVDDMRKANGSMARGWERTRIANNVTVWPTIAERPEARRVMLPPPAGLINEDREWTDRQLARPPTQVSGENRPKAGDSFTAYLMRNSIVTGRWEDEEEGADIGSTVSAPHPCVGPPIQVPQRSAGGGCHCSARSRARACARCLSAASRRLG